MNAVAKKLMIKPGQRWLLISAPVNYLALLDPLPHGVEVSFTADGNFNGIQLFALNSTELAANLQHIQPVLKAGTILWVIYPKKSSGIASDLEMMGSWTEPAKYGLRPVASAAINSSWTALRFRPEEQVKLSETRNSELQKNEFSAYIDIETKTVTLPADMEVALQEQAVAYANFNKLSYANKKEYVLWIVTAKQGKTRAERLTKTLDKLLSGKKNPGDK
ncbi:YdeI family protein [Mucilaginibacter terrae]|uniref:YdeI/OmpD-associated family protein n=1 Tax=Mucilaginibacter terrae TaxID=1955052 RepID=UPI003629E127